MSRLAVFLLASVLAVPVVQAQDVDLRGGFEAGGVRAPLDPQDAEDAETAEGLRGADTARVPVGDAGERIEPLAEVGRVRPLQPFSERLRAVQRRAPNGGGGTLDLEVYDGETRRDAPQGLRAGSFLLYPELITTLGWSDNVAGSAGGSSGSLYRIAPALRLQSDWSRHSFGFNFRGSYTGYPDSDLDADPTMNADARLQFDLSERTELETTARYALTLEDRGSAEAVNEGRDIHELGGSLGLRRSLGLVSAELRGRVDSTVYSGGDNTGTSRERDNALYTATLRLDAQTGASLQPFAEGSLFKRHYFEQCRDLTLCADRNSSGYELRAGVAFDNGGKISGDIGLGWRSETLDDRRLAKLEGLTVDGSLVWSPTRLTTVTGTLSTALAPSTLNGTPGSVIYSGDLRLAHGFSDALAGELGIGYSRRDYTGIVLTEDEANATAGLTWAVTRNVALTGRYTFRRFLSSSQGAGYSENQIEAGLRFRH
ncbi:outer membrane beta-barrel protein [Stappia sp.]|uniref:outer membrane beta-barrel protein n=1 Tax=Stappia sp. TaxID=1870903 RepID=UPI0032D8B675